MQEQAAATLAARTAVAAMAGTSAHMAGTSAAMAGTSAPSTASLSPTFDQLLQLEQLKNSNLQLQLQLSQANLAAPSSQPAAAAKPPKLAKLVLPKFDANDPDLSTIDVDIFLLNFDTASASNGQTSWEDGQYAAAILTQCSGVAARWLMAYLKRDPSIDTDTFRTDFVKRFAAKVRSDEDLAMDKLFNGKYAMRPFRLQEYISRFREILFSLPDMESQQQIRWFQQGLSYDLRMKCLVDNSGSQFTSFDSLIQHAIGRDHVMYHQQLAVNPSRTSSNHSNSNSQRRFSRNRRQESSLEHTIAATTHAETTFVQTPSRKRNDNRQQQGANKHSRVSPSGPREMPPNIAAQLASGKITGISYVKNPRPPFNNLPMKDFLPLLYSGACYNCLGRGHGKGVPCPHKTKPRADDDPKDPRFKQPKH